MIPKVIEAEYVHDYVVHLRFADGTEGDDDLSQELHGVGTVADPTMQVIVGQATVPA